MTETQTETELEAVVHGSRLIRPRSREIYRQAVRSFVEFAGDAPSGWTEDRVIAWRKSLKRRGLGNASVNLHLRALQFAARLRAEKLGKKDFAHNVDVLAAEAKASKSHKKPLSVNEVKKLLKTCDDARPIDLRDRALMTLGFRTGLRRTSVVSLQFEDIKLGANGVTVVSVATRAGNALQLALDDIAVKALNPWLTWLKTHAIETGAVFRALARAKTNGDVSIRADAISQDAITYLLKSRAVESGLDPEIYPDAFRYTFLNWCVEAGVPTARVKAITGAKMHQLLTSSGGVDRPIGDELPKF